MGFVRQPSAWLVWVLVVALVIATVVPLRTVRAADNGPAPLAVGAGRSVRLVNLGGPDGDRLLSRIVADLAVAVERVEAFWGLDWSREIVIVVTGSGREFGVLADGSAGGGTEQRWADIAAVTIADRVDPARRVAVGQRIVFAPGAAQMSESALRIVLAHELFHYAARADTALDAPRWLMEGVADFIARPRTVAAGVPLPEALPSDADLDAPGPQRAHAYEEAWWFTGFVADTYGTAALRNLYQSACGVGHTDPAAAVRAVLGIDMVDALTRWRQWLTQHTPPASHRTGETARA